MEAVEKNETLAKEEKRRLVFEFLEPQIRRKLKKLKHGFDNIQKMVNCLLAIEYNTSDLTVVYLSQMHYFGHYGDYDQTIALHEKFQRFRGRVTSQRRFRRGVGRAIQEVHGTHKQQKRDNMAIRLTGTERIHV